MPYSTSLTLNCGILRSMESYFQTDSWGEFKKLSGWTYDRVAGFLRLSRVLPFGRKIYYLPEVAYDPAKIQEIINVSVHDKAIYSRFDFLEEWDIEKAHKLAEMGLKKSFEEIQPEFRVWVDITKSEEQILAEMKPKGRYNIGVAERHNLEVVKGGKELVGDFFKLYSFTANRTKFSGRNQKYLEELMETLEKDKVGEIILIKKDGELLSGAIILYYKEMASYLYGGSMGDRSLMAPYLMHWTAIKEAKKHNCEIYDLLAVAPIDENGEPVPDHPYTGLTRFKTQFGGRIVRTLGAWDLIHSNFWYKLYQLVEKRRRPKNTN